eukprot:TRINITY_DN25592_c0_g1_i1.p1 TRINITY_DN25592_c0_g1~~TRINITY_DN25592_c0_g1_i1.p1  ORF type:complete len:664 (-),score=128.81 TRINITY_DN25592_c0_g1_i1:363-2354(-)
MATQSTKKRSAEKYLKRKKPLKKQKLNKKTGHSEGSASSKVTGAKSDANKGIATAKHNSSEGFVKTAKTSLTKENGKSIKVKSSEPKHKSHKLDHKQWKELTENRKRKRKPYYDLQKELVALWEKMRQRNIKAEERSRLISTTLDKMKGKIPDIAGSHVTSRVLQTCIKYCQQPERDSVYKELYPHFLKLARNTYAVHLLTKMIDNEGKKRLQEMISSLHGHVVALLRHPVGSIVVENIYKLANGSQKQELVSEFYSPEYRIFKGGKGRLSDLLSGENPTKKASILENISTSLQPILEKGIVDHSIIHRVLFEYLSVSDELSIRDVVQQLSGPLLIRMIHTKDGSKVGALCVRHGSAKERKKIVKGMKGHALKIAYDEYGSFVIMCILSFMDDTSLVNKFILSELADDLKGLSLNKNGRRCLLHLLCPNIPCYFPPDVLEIVRSNHISGSSSKVEGSASLHEDNSADPTAKNDDASERSEEPSKISKKDASTRRFELLVKSGLAQKLIEVCTQNARELLCSQYGKDVIFEVARGGSEGILWPEASDGITLLYRKIADLGAMPQSCNEDGGNEHVFVQYHSSRTIRKLVLESKMPKNVSVPSFAEVLWDTSLKGKCKIWGQGHSEKVVTAFLECPDSKIKEMAELEIQPLLDANVIQFGTEKHS